MGSFHVGFAWRSWWVIDLEGRGARGEVLWWVQSWVLLGLIRKILLEAQSNFLPISLPDQSEPTNQHISLKSHVEEYAVHRTYTARKLTYGPGTCFLQYVNALCSRHTNMAYSIDSQTLWLQRFCPHLQVNAVLALLNLHQNCVQSVSRGSLAYPTGGCQRF